MLHSILHFVLAGWLKVQQLHHLPSQEPSAYCTKRDVANLGYVHSSHVQKIIALTHVVKYVMSGLIRAEYKRVHIDKKHGRGILVIAELQMSFYPFLICAVLLNARHAVNAANGIAAASCHISSRSKLVWKCTAQVSQSRSSRTEKKTQSICGQWQAITRCVRHCQASEPVVPH
jgi:hypothetical protein